MPGKVVKILLIVQIILFSSCNWLESDNPCQKHLEKEKMVNIMTDVFMLESHLSLLQTNASGRDSIPNYYAGIFEKYDISYSEFEAAFECYMLDRELMNQVLDEALNNLSIAKSKADEKIENPETEQLPVGRE